LVDSTFAVNDVDDDGGGDGVTAVAKPSLGLRRCTERSRPCDRVLSICTAKNVIFSVPTALADTSDDDRREHQPLYVRYECTCDKAMQ
jgi:hypothetical protein